MPASIKVYGPLSNIDDDCVVAINALLIFPYFNFIFFFFLIHNSNFQKVTLHKGEKVLGQKEFVSTFIISSIVCL